MEQPRFTWIALGSLSAAFLFYHWGAVNCARNWGETVRTAFDLYRYDLAKRLALEPFGDMLEEHIRWEAFSSFIKRGSYEDFGAFRYPLPKYGVMRDETERGRDEKNEYISRNVAAGAVRYNIIKVKNPREVELLVRKFFSSS